MTLAGRAAGVRVGEVVEARTAEFVAQAYQLGGAPDFGSLVRVGDGTVAVFAFVSQVASGSLDAGRRVTARGQAEASSEAMFQNNPELQALLRTEFTAVVVGYRESGTVMHRLPPQPPRLHGFVYACDDDDLRAFTERTDYLPTLVATGVRGPSDELIGAALRRAAAVQPDPHGYVVTAGKRLATLLANDVRRLSAILRCAQP